ncbi:GAF domain-containing protein [Actinoplanes sp. NBC_00393]|uniref:GAF domain-containing protein n=1 Tax=Actinoplanes sp. NBC_00393 TaxID=2975953 RepID=UPI002E1BC73A
MGDHARAPAPGALPRAEAFAEQARLRYAEATLLMRRAHRARNEATDRREAAEAWHREVHNELRSRRREVSARTAEAAREAAALRPAGRSGLVLFGTDFCGVHDPTAIMSATLAAALTLSQARMGHVQLFDDASDGLRIVSQYGFGRDFLNFFALVRDRDTACGAALAEARTVQVRDVGQSVLFAGTKAGEVLLDAGVRAVRSIPLISNGLRLGVLSVHYSAPHEPDAAEQHLLATVASAGARRLVRPPVLPLGGEPAGDGDGAAGVAPGDQRGPQAR